MSFEIAELPVEAVFVKNGEETWVWSKDRKIESHDPADRVGGPYHISAMCDEDFGYYSKWFLFSIVDSHFPQTYLVCADSFETAYETFVEWQTPQLAIDESDIHDYDLNDLRYGANGTPVDTDNVRGVEVKLQRFDFLY